MGIEYFFKHISTSDIVGAVTALIVMCSLSFYVSRFRKNPVNIVGSKNIFFTFSAIVTMLFIVVIIYSFSTGNIRKSLEFTGGTMLEVGFADENVSSEDISREVEKYGKTISEGLATPIIQMISNPKKVEYPDEMRRVSVTLSYAMGEDLNALALALGAKLGKVQLEDILDDSGQSAGTKTLVLLVAPQDGLFEEVFPITDKKPEEDKKNYFGFSDNNLIAEVLEQYDPNIKLEKLEVGDLVAPKTAVQEYKSAMIRVTKTNGNQLSNHEASILVADMAKKFQNIYLFKHESIGPSVGQELAQKAFTAVVVALILQLLYITIRFNRQARYGIMSVVSLIHVLIIMFGVYAIAGREIDSPFVAAILTVIGYAVMDSIIIYDRIRENLKIYSKESYAEVVNKSINQSISRSVNTLLTVLMTLFALFFFGGETLKNFAFALIIGCSVGAYSSIFLSAPLVVLADDRVKREKQMLLETKKEAAEQELKDKESSKEEKKGKKRLTSLRASKRKTQKETEKESSEEE